MRTSIIVFLAICLSSITDASSSRTDSPPSEEASTTADTTKSATELIILLDNEVQRRFKDTKKGFGMSRLDGIDPNHKAHVFQPENAAELAVVNELQKSSTNVLIYLGSLSLYGPKPESNECDGRLSRNFGCLRKFIRGPVQVTQSPISDAPEGQAFWDEAAKAITLFDKSSDSEHTFTYKDWNFSARPIRATEEECLLCHSGRGATAKSSKEKKPLQLEDPLGVVIYGYRISLKN